jgi:hypothetical protein
MASIFLGSNVFPYFETMNLEIVSKQTMNAHFFKFRRMPYSLHLRKKMKFFKWVDKLLKTIKSSKKIFMNTSMYS